jgi:hypothetical protein
MLTRRVTLLRYTLLAALFLGYASTAIAQAAPRAIRLAHIEGTVRVLNGSKTTYMKAYANMPLMEGARLQTMEDGTAEIESEDGSLFRIIPNSILQISNLRWDGSNAPQTEISLFNGVGYFEIKPDHDGAVTRIRVATEVIAAEEPSILRVTQENGPALVDVLSGTVRVTNGADLYHVDVRAGEDLSTDMDDASRYFLNKGIQQDSWDQWNLDRDSALAARLAQQTKASAGLPIASNPAIEDLDESGEWYDVPNTGYVWAPSNVGEDWDPYGYGYWINYPGFGYSFVSGYSWGYLPYTCGEWNFFNGFGWGWAPRGCNAWGFGFVPGIILVNNVPPRWNRPVVPGPGPHKPGRIVPVGALYKPLASVNRIPGRAVVIAGNAINPSPMLHEHNFEATGADNATFGGVVTSIISGNSRSVYRYGDISGGVSTGTSNSIRTTRPVTTTRGVTGIGSAPHNTTTSAEAPVRTSTPAPSHSSPSYTPRSSYSPPSYSHTSPPASSLPAGSRTSPR